MRSQRAFLLSTTKSFWNLVMSGLSVTLIPGTVSVMIQWEPEEIENNAIALWTFWKWPQHLPSVVTSVAECSSSRVFKYLGITLVLSLDYPQMDLTAHASCKLKKPYKCFSNAIEVKYFGRATNTHSRNNQKVLRESWTIWLKTKWGRCTDEMLLEFARCLDRKW